MAIHILIVGFVGSKITRWGVEKGESDMGYWKWLREWIKAVTSWQRIKTVLKSPTMEFLIGFVGGGMLIGLGIGLGVRDNCLYYLLTLAAIPCILIALHGEYRDEMRRKGH